MHVRPSHQTGSVVPSPPGVSWSFVGSPRRDSVQQNAGPSNLFGGVATAGNAEPGLMTPTSSGYFVAPSQSQLPPLADVLRLILNQILGR